MLGSCSICNVRLHISECNIRLRYTSYDYLNKPHSLSFSLEEAHGPGRAPLVKREHLPSPIDFVQPDPVAFPLPVATGNMFKRIFPNTVTAHEDQTSHRPKRH